MTSALCSVNRFFIVTLNLLLVVLCICCISLGSFLLLYTEDGYAYLKKLLHLPEFVDVQPAPNDNSIWAVKSAAWIMITFGCVVGPFSFLGCWGAMKEWVNMLVIYAFLLVLLAIAKAAAINFLMKQVQSLPRLMQTSMQPTISSNFVPMSSNEYTDDSHLRYKTFTLFINAIQVYKECCFFHPAVRNFRGQKWSSSSPRISPGGSTIRVPVACCPVDQSRISELTNVNRWLTLGTMLRNRNCPSSEQGVHRTSCYQAITDAITANMQIVYLLIGGLAVTEVTLAFLSLLFAYAPGSVFGESIYN